MTAAGFTLRHRFWPRSDLPVYLRHRSVRWHHGPRRGVSVPGPRSMPAGLRR